MISWPGCIGSRLGNDLCIYVDQSDELHGYPIYPGDAARFPFRDYLYVVIHLAG